MSEDINHPQLAVDIKAWAKELGFSACGIADTDLSEDEARFKRWLAAKRYASMTWFAERGLMRTRPAELHPGTIRIISVRMDYRHIDIDQSWATLADGEKAYISRYALGRDYHKLIRKRLQKLAKRIEQKVGPFGYRAFADSAPVLEKALARKAGTGWVGKHTLLLSRTGSSWSFLGELFTDLPLPVDQPVEEHCGSCRRCIDVCPTGAITAPYELDAERCITYQTIENKGSIPVELRAPIGNRVFGCDDCQLVCPWNKFAELAEEPDFAPRHGLDNARLVDLFAWSEQEFLAHTEGMAIRRTGYIGWLRNIAVALGNAPHSAAVVDALQARAGHESALVREHVAWALAQQAARHTDQTTASR